MRDGECSIVSVGGSARSAGSATRLDVLCACASKALRMAYLRVGDGQSEKHHHPGVDQDDRSGADPLSQDAGQPKSGRDAPIGNHG